MSQSSAAPGAEITVRGVILGIAITLVFTAAQVYLGLKVGLTFATSIPAAVISMALLRAFRDSTIQENNIVQTIASAAGTLAAVIFVLPGLLIIGWWAEVPFWIAFAACATGGILGVMYTIPLRRALVTDSKLPYPEGVAAAEVLKVGSGSREGAREGKAGLIAVVLGSIASALYATAVAAKLFAAEIGGFVKAGVGATGLFATSSLALIGAGHLVGIGVGLAMLFGLFIAWGVLVPLLTNLTPAPDGTDLFTYANGLWRTQVRFIGAGTIGIAALWTLSKLAMPVWTGLVSSLDAARARKAGGASSLPRVEQDIPIGIVGLVSVITLAPAGWLMMHFLDGTAIEGLSTSLVLIGVLYLLFAGMLAAAVCGYMAGLVGSSNSPVSGVAILSILGAALLIGAVGHGATGADAQTALIAFGLFVTAILLAVAVVANDNLQDLKTGQLVGATPWKQQVALVIGVIAGSMVVPPVLDMLNSAYGFAGAPSAHAVAAEPLNAPQATLITALARGVIGGDLDWALLGYGALIGVGLVLIDLGLKRTTKDRYALPPLAVGLAIYLPSAVTVPVIIGAVLGWWYVNWVNTDKTREVAKRLAVLVASGFIVGESLFNVGLSGLIVGTDNGEPLALGIDLGEGMMMLNALVVLIIVVMGLYVWCRRAADKVDD
ncbi:MAG: oligopeptide transporter, OPT family [Micropepsaceae bacterium]